ncbi:unnamed protein product [Rotaria magnacalcarata]
MISVANADKTKYHIRDTTIMPLALHTTLTVSCAVSEERTGPTLVHSSGVESYRVHPEVIRLLQESCTNEKLCDHEKGVQCTDPPAHILQAFQRAGFSETMSSTADDRKIWLLTKTSEGGADQPVVPAEEEPEDEGNAEEEEPEEEQ